MVKICVYAIAKNEIKHLKRWYNSVKEADYICVLDTGSTDGTYEACKDLGIICNQITYENFRFDTARNDSMKLIPEDATVCVCIDIDEVISPGWSQVVKSSWQDNTGRATYKYVWNFNPDGSEGVVFMSDKIHRKDLFKWINPVHEILSPTNNNHYEIISLTNFQIDHHADITKSRSQYLPLLELSVKENPNNDRNIHYLGREYMYNKQYLKAIKTLKKHLTLKTSNWDLERSASLRYIAKCYHNLNKPKLEEKYLQLALLESNTSRETYMDLAVYYFNNKKYLLSALFFKEMLKINTRNLNYISSPTCWGELPYDYLSLCYYYLGNLKLAIITINKAIEIKPSERLLKNKLFFTNQFNIKKINKK